MKVVIIGGGPAGMLASISARRSGDEVILLEKMEELGKKLLITGKGRCNITSSLPIEEFIQNIPGNGMFLYSSFNNYNNQDIIELLKEEKVEVKEERGNRIFPVTDSAKDVRDALLKRLNKLGVKIQTNARVEKIIADEEEKGQQGKQKIVAVEYCINGKKKQQEADKVIIATGGRSYSATGSTGDGYTLAKNLGHTITEIKPSLVPLTASKSSLQLCQDMQGLSLRNVSIKLKDKLKNKIIYQDFGEMLFTHWGVSGPTILSASAHLLRYPNVKELLSQNNVILSIDLKPALTEEKLEERILRDFGVEKNKEFKNSLDKLLPQKMIETVVELSEIERTKKVNSITKSERQRLVQILKKFEISINGFRPIEEAIVTSGGVSIKEINPKTMESKLVSGLYFAGEVIDVDAYTGGFNLQIAYSTGFTAGLKK